MSSVPPPPLDYLDSSGGDALPPQPRRSRGPRRPVLRGLILGGVVVLLCAVGYGAWAAYSFFQTGDQPAEALPASTLGYVSIDLDPSGGQKIAALRTLNKFPAFKDKVGVSSTDDLREKVFDAVQDAGQCTTLDYDQDIKPWLGERAAVAAVDTGGAKPAEVVVLQVTDDSKAEKGLTALRTCAGADAGQLSWHVDGDWAVLAQTQETADTVAKDAASHPLADDSDFKHWTDEAGDPGVVTMYAAPSAGAYLADHVDQLGAFPMGLTGMDTVSSYASTPNATPASQIPDSIKSRLRDFKGAAATIRFSDGGVELAVASDSTVSKGTLGDSGGSAGSLVQSLPSDTGAALGVGFRDGWFGDLLDQVSSYTGQSAADLESTLEQASGLDLPQDIETLTGKAVALSAGPGLDPDALSGSTGPSGLQVALKVQGDPDAITAVLAKLTGQGPAGELAQGFLGTDTQGDTVAIGPDPGYRADVVKDGSLGRSKAFLDVVPDADKASAILFVDLDRYDALLQKVVGGDSELLDNLKPLAGLGLSGWTDGDTSHVVLRVSTD